MDDDLVDLCDIKVRHVLPRDITPSLFCKGTRSKTFWIVLYGRLPCTVFYINWFCDHEWERAGSIKVREC